MRAPLVLVAAVAAPVIAALALGACSNAENAGAAEARRQAEAEQKAKAAKVAPAKMQPAPVRGEAHIPCTQLVDLGAFQTALGEKDPLELRDTGKAEVKPESKPQLDEMAKLLQAQPALLRPEHLVGSACLQKGHAACGRHSLLLQGLVDGTHSRLGHSTQPLALLGLVGVGAPGGLCPLQIPVAIGGPADASRLLGLAHGGLAHAERTGERSDWARSQR